jgi:hypothetical protein
MRTRTGVLCLVALLLFVTLPLYADGAAPPLIGVSHDLRSDELLVYYTYGGDTSGYTRQIVYQVTKGGLASQPTPEPFDSADLTRLTKRFAATALGDYDAIQFAAELRDPNGQLVSRSPEYRVSLISYQGLRSSDAKIAAAEQQQRAAEAARDVALARLRTLDDALPTTITYGGAPKAVLPTRAVLPFVLDKAGLIEVALRDVTAGSDLPPVRSGYGTAHDVEVKGLTAQHAYEATAWILDWSGTRTAAMTSAAKDVRLKFSSASPAPLTLHPLTASGVTHDSVTVEVRANRAAAVLVTPYRVVDDNKPLQMLPPKGDQTRDTYERPLPSALVPTTAWPKSYVFDGLEADTKYRFVVTALNEYGEAADAPTQWTVTTAKGPTAFDFADAIHINITPGGYLLEWRATAKPGDGGFSVTFDGDAKPTVVSKAATIDDTKVSSILDVDSFRKVLTTAKDKQSQPILRAWMTKDGKTIDRSFVVAFAVPDKAQVDKLQLSDPEKTKLLKAIDAAKGFNWKNVDWGKLAKVGIDLLL